MHDHTHLLWSCVDEINQRLIIDGVALCGATEKGVIPVLDAGIHLRKSLCCKEIDYRVKPDNDNFRSFSATLLYAALFF